MKLYYTMGIDESAGGNNYANVMTCYFFKTEEEAKEKEEELQGYGYETDIDSFNGSKGWLVAWGTAYDDFRVEPMAEAKARKLCADWDTLAVALDVEDGEDEESRAFYFKKFTPNSYCTTSVDANPGRGIKWQFSSYSEEIRESVKTTFKYVPTFEAFLNEAKVELGSIDSRSMEDKWKMEQVNDILKGAVGKTCTALDIKSLAGSQIDFDGDDRELKNIKCKIKDIDVSGSYASLVHFVGFTYDEDDGTEGYDRFTISYPKANSKKGLEIFSKFADIFGLGDITPNFSDEKGNVTDYDNVDYYGKLSVNCYQFIKGSMSKMVSFMQADDVRLYGNDHTAGAGIVLCNKKDLKKIHADLLDGFDGKKPRLNNIPMIGLDAKAEENGSVTDSPIYQKKWAKVCQFLGASNTSDLVCVNILMRLGGPSTNHANNSFSKDEIDYAEVQYNGFDGWSRANVPEGIAPLVKRIRVKKYAGGKLS